MTTATTTFTATELVGLAQFEASIPKSTPIQRQTSLAALRPGGSAERMPGAPRREVLDEMARRLETALASPAR